MIDGGDGFVVGSPVFFGLPLEVGVVIHSQRVCTYSHHIWAVQMLFTLAVFPLKICHPHPEFNPLVTLITLDCRPSVH